MKKVFVVPVRIWAFMEMLKEFKFRLKENKCAKTLERKSLFIVLYFICRNHRDEVLKWGKRWLLPDTISVTVERRRSPHWKLANVILSPFHFHFLFWTSSCWCHILLFSLSLFCSFNLNLSSYILSDWRMSTCSFSTADVQLNDSIPVTVLFIFSCFYP